MEISSLIPHIESLIFASDKPLTTLEITDLINNAFGFMEDKITPEQIDAAIEGIVEKYSSEFYPFAVRQSGGGWQFLTKKEYHKTVAQLNGEKFLKRLSAAALETLAIIAYKQPVTKGEIELIRGVSADYSIQKLLEKELIIISGRNEELPGHPLVYATSKTFMDYFGINSPADLPKIKEVLADQLVEPTIVNNTEFEQGSLLVTDDGELVETESDKEAKTVDATAEPDNTSSGAVLYIDDADQADNESDDGPVLDVNQDADEQDKDAEDLQDTGNGEEGGPDAADEDENSPLNDPQ